MRFPQSKRAGRPGFTLIEMLVVIAIIGILVGLLMAAVMYWLDKPAAVRDRADITNMAQSLKNFYASNKFYPPSRIFLANNYALYNQSNPLHVQSLSYLRRMWPQLDWRQPIDWSGGLNTNLLNTQGVILEGDQCLVFFLGGIPTISNGVNACIGFSTNKRNPTAPSAGGAERLKFYDFRSERLYMRTAAPFFSYKNTYDDLAQPYLYFSSNTKQNGYNSAVSGFGNSDCASLGVNPYAEAWPDPTTGQPPVRFVNSNTFQIISAGPDGQFGAGTTSQATVWAPTRPTMDANGKDDLSNFSDVGLGVGQ